MNDGITSDLIRYCDKSLNRFEEMSEYLRELNKLCLVPTKDELGDEITVTKELVSAKS